MSELKKFYIPKPAVLHQKFMSLQDIYAFVDDTFVNSLFVCCVKENDFECVPTCLMEHVLKFLNVSTLSNFLFKEDILYFFVSSCEFFSSIIAGCQRRATMFDGKGLGNYQERDSKIQWRSMHGKIIWRW